MRKLHLKNLTAALVVAVSFALPAAAQEPTGLQTQRILPQLWGKTHGGKRRLAGR